VAGNQKPETRNQKLIRAEARKSKGQRHRGTKAQSGILNHEDHEEHEGTK